MSRLVPAFSDMASFLPVGGKEGEFASQMSYKRKDFFSLIIRVYLASFAWKVF